MVWRIGVVASVLAAACGPVGAAGGGGAVGASGGGGVVDAAAPPAPPVPLPASGDAAVTTGGYSVEGSTVYDAAHHPHLFHGVARPSLEWSSGGEKLSQDDYRLMASWKANVVRIALNQDFWISDSPAFDAAYAPLVDEQVQWAEAAGLDVILDLHWSDRGDYAQTPGQQRMADAHSVTFWSQVASRYKSDPRVLFELYNEPHDVSWDVWLNGGQSGDGFVVRGMQALYDAVRATGAPNLVVIGGLQFAFDLSGVATHRVKGRDILWATHPYNQKGKQPSNFDAAFGTLAATDPVIATEFGDTTSCDADYNAEVITYADAHHVSWTSWAWFVSGCTFPSIIADWSGTPNAAGQVVKAALAGY